MSIRKVNVVDSGGQHLVASVDEDRLAVIEAGVRQEAAKIITADSFRSVMNRQMTAGDAQEALAFLVSQLAYTEQGLFERQYVPMQYERFVPISYEAGEWVDTIRYEIYDHVGNAKDMGAGSDDINEVDVAYADATFNVAYGTVGYSFTQEELRRTAYLRRPLPERKLATAMEAWQRRMNVVALTGNSKKGFTGLYNNANVTHATNPSGKAWSASSGITVAEILSDFAYGMNAVWNGTAFNTIPDTVIVPPTAYEYISALPLSTSNASNVTVLNWLLANNLYNQERSGQITIAPGYDLATAGASSASRTVFYEKTDKNLVFHIPMPLRFLAPQLEGVKVKVPGEFKYSGVEVRRPGTMYYMDGC
jgi:hypothetical protein